MSYSIIYHAMSFYFFYIYFWETEWEKACVGEGQRQKETQNLKRAPGSEQAVSAEPDVGLKPPNCEIMTWAEVGGSTDRATQVPPCYGLSFSFIKCATVFCKLSRASLGTCYRILLRSLPRFQLSVFTSINSSLSEFISNPTCPHGLIFQ